jgi:hypothetical protein
MEPSTYMGSSDRAAGSRVSGALSAKCPSCQKLVHGNTLKDLRKQVLKCISLDAKTLPALTLPIEFVFNRSILSQNKTTYAHWTAYDKDKKDWFCRIERACSCLFNRLLPYSEWSIERKYSAPSKEFDLANLVGGAKPIPDVLKKLHIIVDDAPSYFKCEYIQTKADETCTILRLLKTSQSK